MIDIRPVTPALWNDLESFLQSGSWSRQCWCMVWRARGAETRNTDRAFRKSLMERRVKSGEIVGLLAYDENGPVGWCSIAPRVTYGKLGGPDDYRDDPNAVWSLTCFSLAKGHRKQGLSGTLLESAIDYARENGARVIEAYPVAPRFPELSVYGADPAVRTSRLCLRPERREAPTGSQAGAIMQRSGARLNAPPASASCRACKAPNRRSRDNGTAAIRAPSGSSSAATPAGTSRQTP